MESWRDIPGFEGRYQASDLGRIRSLDRWVRSRGGYRRALGRVLKQQPHSAGYLQVRLSGKTKIIGPLVLEAFGSPRPAGHECAHGDGVKHSNALENLRWATPLGNSNDRRLHGTSGAGETNAAAKLTRAQVSAIRADARAQTAIAKSFGIAQATVSKIKRGDRWAA